MGADSKIWLALKLVFPVVFNIAFFMLAGFQQPLSVWVSWAFVNVAYVVAMAVPGMVRRNGAVPAESAVDMVAGGYFLLEFIVGMVFIAQAQPEPALAAVVQLALLGVFAVVLFTNVLADGATSQSTARRQAEVAYLRDATHRVQALMGRVGDPASEAAIERAYDVLAASPTASGEHAVPYELALLDAIAYLEQAVASGNLQSVQVCARRVVDAAAERNRRLRA